MTENTGVILLNAIDIGACSGTPAVTITAIVHVASVASDPITQTDDTSAYTSFKTNWADIRSITLTAA